MTVHTRRAALPGAVAILAFFLFVPAACGPGGETDAPLDDVRDTLAEDTTVRGADSSDLPIVVDSEGMEDEAAPPADTPGTGGSADGGQLRTTELTPPGWTSGRIQVETPGTEGLPEIVTVREARHDGFDRLVVEFVGGLPTYDVEYVDRPLHECGSGHEVHPEGDGWLQIRLRGARGHTEAGESRLERERDTPGLTRGVHLYRTCDFEGEVTLVLAVDSPEPFRAFDLDGPPRIVVDVQH